MEKITVKIHRSVKEEREVSLPFYSQSDCYYYFIKSADESVVVCYAPFSNIYSIDISRAYKELALNGDVITEAEFKEALEKVKSVINNL